MHLSAENVHEILQQVVDDGIGGQSSVLVLVAPTVGALAAARILLTLLRHEFVAYQLVPVFSNDDVARAHADMVVDNVELRTVFMIECGGTMDLSRVFPVDERVRIYVFDSHRPYNLENVFVSTSVYVVDDPAAYMGLRALAPPYATELGRPDGSSDEDDDDEDDDDDDGVSDKENRGNVRDPIQLGKRPRRRPRDALSRRVRRRAERLREHPEVRAYLTAGSAYGTTAAEMLLRGTSSRAADSLESVWLAIVSLTEQLVTEQIARDVYDDRLRFLQSEVTRLSLNDATAEGVQTADTSDVRIRSLPNEYRFMLYRHWSLYESMRHSPYVATQLHLWQEKGLSTFQMMFARMGLSLQQVKEPWPTMATQLKTELQQRVERDMREAGLEDIVFPSFAKEVGYRVPLSASDVVYAVNALLEAPDDVAIQPVGEGQMGAGASRDSAWSANFFRAYDALDPTRIDTLMQAVKLAISFQEKVVRVGTALVQQKKVFSSRNFRFARLEDGGPDTQHFVQPHALTRLALFVMTASHATPKHKKRMPFVLSVKNMANNMYAVVGVHPPADTPGDVRRNRFSDAFKRATVEADAEHRGHGFDASVIEVSSRDHKRFLEYLQLVR